MEYVSTRGAPGWFDFAEVLLRGLALDGGLFAPADWPRLMPEARERARSASYADTVVDVLEPFTGDALPAGALRAAADAAQATFARPEVTPLVQLEPDLWLLELFHGPAAAFKDLAMQLMAPLTRAALAVRGERLLLVTATSGDTGAAAVAAFAGVENVDLVVFHPLDRVSPVQRLQMTTVDAANVLNLGVEGDFDDCQRLVKGLLADAELAGDGRVSSMNSINWGRLCGQVPYFLRAAEALAKPGRTVDLVVPTGNFGDAFAGWAARRMGAPIGELTAAVNLNDSLLRALEDGRYARRPTQPTASVSMDVGAPSNFERLVFEASGRDAERTAGLFACFATEDVVDLPPDLLAALRAEITVARVDDADTAAAIAGAWARYGRVVCPHTAVALHVAQSRRRQRPTVVLATAHPAKFPEFVSQALGFAPPEPEAFAGLRERPERVTTLAPDLEAAKAAVLRWRGSRGG